MHLQETVTNWTDCLPRLPDGTLVKAVDRGDLLRTAKQIKPGCVTLLRHWYDHGQHYDNAPYSVKLDRARTFFNSFLDGTFYQQYASFVDIIAGWNEVWAESQTAQEKADRVEQERAMIQVFKAEHAPRLPAHVRYGMASSAVGNSQPREMYQLAVQEDCYIQDHPYSHWVQGVRSAGDWPNLSGLWNRKEIEYGIKPRYVFDEGGPFESAVDGWRSNKCLGGSVSAYVGAVRAWIQDVKQTAAYKEGRIIGPVALFTTGRQSASWSTYWTEQPELNALADMFRAEWKPGAVIPPSTPLPITPLSQRDPRWSSHIMGPDATGRVRTIGDFGCLVTDWAMMLQAWEISTLNPAELWEYIKARGGTNGAYLRGGALATAFPDDVKYNGFTSGGPTLYAQIRANKDKGIITPVRVDFNPMTPEQEEHWLDVIDYLPNDNFLAADPWTGKRIIINDVYGIPGPDVLAAQWYEPITSAPPPPPRRYPRVCHLLPQDATPAEYDRVTSEAYALRQSVMSSIDDALITHPNLTSRTVIVWGALPRHGAFTDKASFEAWVTANYPPLPTIQYRTF